jgi:5-methyltetrahydropteroyltriglutamate--homocysteine methyltransferase
MITTFPSGMKKWFTSNYHYMVPEVDTTSTVKPDFSAYLANVKRGVEYLGADRAVPVIMGPVTLAKLVQFKLGTAAVGLQRLALLDEIIPIYRELIKDLANMGVKEVQIHEPALIFGDASMQPLLDQVYPAVFPKDVALPAINMVSFFEDVGEANYKFLIGLKDVSIISLDFTRGESLSLLRKFGFPASKTLGAGLVDGRTIWKVNPTNTIPLLLELLSISPSLRIQPSSSLQYVPWDLDCEVDIVAHPAGCVFAFGKQKLLELTVVATAVNNKSFQMTDHTAAWAKYHSAVGANKPVKQRVAALTEADFCRSEPYETRRSKQLKGLPILPTTTIGSFPQTAEVRNLRTKLKSGALTQEGYNAAIDIQIAFAIGIQEALGLDIFVHGEAERTDMVEFFAQNMNGMLFSLNGWVQSFGSRCVRPPIFWSDISRRGAMTTREFIVAQALTRKPVKGMLTGPVTILNWSFPRVDISRKEQAMQIGLAIRDEIHDLEQAGCTVIQVDEPALREAMPLRQAQKDEYLTWTVDSFRLATAGAKSETQIHTHMCYCEFGDCMDAIDRLDTDVNSIENARSDDATLVAFAEIGYTKGLGPGTYDIHSPVVPTVEFIEDKIRSFIRCTPVENLVINPDCGLKTRTWPETIGALQNMIAANNAIRETLM